MKALPNILRYLMVLYLQDVKDDIVSLAHLGTSLTSQANTNKIGLHRILCKSSNVIRSSPIRSFILSLWLGIVPLPSQNFYSLTFVMPHQSAHNIRCMDWKAKKCLHWSMSLLGPCARISWSCPSQNSCTPGGQVNRINWPKQHHDSDSTG